MTNHTPDEALVALLDIREKIAACRQQEGRELAADTWRHRAEDIAAAFVDSIWAAEEETE